jgi:hypothetical protein
VRLSATVGAVGQGRAHFVQRFVQRPRTVNLSLIARIRIVVPWRQPNVPFRDSVRLTQAAPYTTRLCALRLRPGPCSPSSQ